MRGGSWGSRGRQRPSAQSARGHARAKGASRGGAAHARGWRGHAPGGPRGGQRGPRWLGKVNGAQVSGPLDGVCFRGRNQARSDTAALEDLVAVRPNLAKLRELERQACASGRQVALPGESDQARPGSAKLNAKVSVHLPEGTLRRGRRGWGLPARALRGMQRNRALAAPACDRAG